MSKVIINPQIKILKLLKRSITHILETKLKTIINNPILRIIRTYPGVYLKIIHSLGFVIMLVIWTKSTYRGSMFEVVTVD